MALLYFNGFEGMNTAGLTADEYIRRRHLAYMTPLWYSQVGQYGLGCALSGSYNSLYVPPWPTTDRTLYIGVAFKEITYANDSWIFQLLQPPAPGVGGAMEAGIGFLYMADEQEIRVYRGGTILWTTDTGGSISMEHWHWLEFKVYCDNASGTVEIRRAGTTILSETGDTQFKPTVNYHSGLLISNGSSRVLYWDNLYVCDSTGAKNNGFLGPVRVVTMLPESDGDETDWTPTPGGSHFSAVDEMQLVDYNDFIESSTVNDKDLWEYTAASNIGTTVFAVQVITDARAVDGASSRLLTLAKTGATETPDAGLPLKTTFVAIPSLMEVQPAGAGDWTVAALNAYQFGVKHAEV